jgi:hypothetical protein
MRTLRSAVAITPTPLDRQSAPVIRALCIRFSTYVSTFASLALVTGCTVVSNFDIEQCDSDADCNSLVSPLSHCVRSRCEPGCVSNRQCSTRDPRYPICTEPSGVCTSLTSPDGECYVSTAYDDDTMGGLTAAGMTLVAAFSPDIRASSWLSISLAVDELNASARAAGSPQAPVVAVLCNDAPQGISSVLQHVLERLGARVVLASLEDESLRIAVNLSSTAKQPFFLSPFAVPIDAVAQEEASPALWYLGGLQGDMIPVYSALVTRGLEALRSTGVAEPRMLGIVGDTSEDAALADAVESVLAVDGYGARDLMALDRYRRVVLSDDSPDSRETTLDTVVRYQPQLVWAFVGGRFTVPAGLARSSFVTSLDAALRDNAAPEPLFIFGPRSRDDATLMTLARTTPGFRTSALGVDIQRPMDIDILRSAEERFRQAFPAASADEAGLSLSAAIYDGIYYLVYAMSYAAVDLRASRNQLELTSLIAGLQRATDANGLSVTVGPGAMGVDAAALAIAQQVPIDFVGTTGPAAFDFVLRARPTEPRLYCWSEGGAPTDLGGYDDGRAFDSSPCAQADLDEP